MKKVMVFGAFDILHPGHSYFFKEAAKHGDFLIAVVARDTTIKAVKNEFPSENEQLRLKKVGKSVDRAVLGDDRDVYKVIKDEKPDVICLGYDQKAFIDKLQEKLDTFGLKTEIMRLDAFKEHKYKSSIIKNSHT